MTVDIVIVSYNTRDLLRDCLEAVRADTGGDASVHIVVVDNASGDGSAGMVRETFPEVEVVELDANYGFGTANNRGAETGSAPFVLFLNSDAMVQPGAIKTLAGFIDADPKCVAVGPRLQYPDGRFHPSCRRFPTPLRAFWQRTGFHKKSPGLFTGLHDWLPEADHAHGRRVDMVSGACVMMRRDYFERLGGFDEQLFLYEEEMDLLYPAKRQGKTVRFCGDALVTHYHGASSNNDTASATALTHRARSRYYCFRKHYGTMSTYLGYWLETGVIRASFLWNRLRGRDSDAGTHLEACRTGFRQAMGLSLIDNGRSGHS